jgi:hypothetical protein
MNIEEQKTILVVASYAAFAGGVKGERDMGRVMSMVRA